jgi:hypothetical protein
LADAKSLKFIEDLKKRSGEKEPPKKSKKHSPVKKQKMKQLMGHHYACA